MALTDKEQETIKRRVLADKDFMAGIRRGVAAYRAGKMRLWSEVKKELGIKT